MRLSTITLGLAYYGRSFTLTDPSCNDPGCRFTEGARPGVCTGAAGVLSLAEIERIRSTEDVVEGYDMTAAVKWMTWDSDQVKSFTSSHLPMLPRLSYMPSLPVDRS